MFKLLKPENIPKFYKEHKSVFTEHRLCAKILARC